MKRILLLLLLLPSFSNFALAEDPNKEKTSFFSRVANKLSASFDTTYVEPHPYRFSVIVQNTNIFQQYLLRASNGDGTIQSLCFSPVPAMRVGPYFGWGSLCLGYTFDVVKLGNGAETKRTDLNFSMYKRRVGFDLVYQRNSGDFHLLRTRGLGNGVPTGRSPEAALEGMKTHVFSLNAYYVFNYRRFSYPAAYSKDSRQRKSQGSWILGLRYDHQKADFDYASLPTELVGTAEDPRLFSGLQFKRFKSDNISVSGGYAYNWVFARNWLFSVSLTPGVGINFSEEKRADEIKHKARLNFNAIGRAGLVWTSARYFAGASLISNVYYYNGASRFSYTNSLQYFNIYFGVKFGKKK